MAQSVKKSNNQQVKKVQAKENIINEETNIENAQIIEEKEITSTQNSELESLKQELKSKDDKVEELSKALEMMQAQMQAFINGASRQVQNNTRDNEDVLVGCRGIYGGVLATSDGRHTFKFECDEEKYIDSEDLRELFRDSSRNNKRNFEDDVFYFVDAKHYDKFKIRKRADLSPDNIVRILCLPPYKMIDEFNILTNNKNSFWTMQEFRFQVVKLLIKKDERLSRWPFESRIELEKYIGQSFDQLMASVGALELLGRKKYDR